MGKAAPFTEDELKVWNIIGQLCSEWQKLKPTHPMDISDMADGIHKLQDVLGRRVLRREYPHSFASYIKHPISHAWVPEKENTHG